MNIIKSLHQYFGNKNKLPKRVIKLEKPQHKDLDFIMRCINDGVKEGHFKPIAREEIDEMITKPNKKPLSSLFIIKINKKLAGIVMENKYPEPKQLPKQLPSYVIHLLKNHCIRNDLSGEKLYGLEINMIYVAKKFRNMGIATEAISYCEEESDSSKILARCEQNNSKEAIALFKKLGYKDIGFNEQSKLTHRILEKVVIKEQSQQII